MSLDTKYRPKNFSDVLGQDSTKSVLKSYITTGSGFHQSYIIDGPFGSGKTTLGRILARALLCDAPVDGEPCGVCSSCVEILERGYSENFVEIDAATNSGKADMIRIKEGIEYQTFSGKRKLYLLDEAHAMSKDGSDAILKDLEDNVPGSKDKRLVCIFCTTELEKLRPAIKSRCAPVFHVHPLEPSIVADRLAFVCEQEGFKYEREALLVISEATEVHIRDALKALEAVSLMGSITLDNVKNYFNLDVASLYLDLLLRLESDLPWVISNLQDLVKKVSPSVIYQRLAEASMFAYHLHLGSAKPYIYWDQDKLKALSGKQDLLLKYASSLTAKPFKPSLASLICDLSILSKYKEGLSIPNIHNITTQIPVTFTEHKPVSVPSLVVENKPQTIVKPTPTQHLPVPLSNLSNPSNIAQLYQTKENDPLLATLASGVKVSHESPIYENTPLQIKQTQPTIVNKEQAQAQEIVRVQNNIAPISNNEPKFSNSNLIDQDAFIQGIASFVKELENGFKRQT